MQNNVSTDQTEIVVLMVSNGNLAIFNSLIRPTVLLNTPLIVSRVYYKLYRYSSRAVTRHYVDAAARTVRLKFIKFV